MYLQNPETRKWDDEGVVVEKIRKRTYQIKLKNAKITHRNRRQIKRRNISLTEEHSISSRAKEQAAKEDVDEEKEPKPRRSERISKRK